jgi:hypothetical protein
MRILLNRIIARTLRRLIHDGWLVEDPEQPYLDLEPQDALDELSAASIRYRIADGPGAGQRTLSLGSPSLARTNSPKTLTVDRDGFSLKRRLIAWQSAKQFAWRTASVACDAHQRSRLERVARYVTRPAIGMDRLSIDSRGHIVLELKTPFRNGTTHILFTPEDFMARLAALVPRPRANLTRYHGVFAPNCTLRRRVVPSPSGATRKRHRGNREGDAKHDDPPPVNDDSVPIAPLRVFLIEISVCPCCGGKLRWIADVTDPDLIHRILEHLRSRPPARAGPGRSACGRPQRGRRRIRLLS